MVVLCAWEQWRQKKRSRTTAFKWEQIRQLSKEARPVTFFVADFFFFFSFLILAKQFFWGLGELKPSKNNGEKFPVLRRALCLPLTAPGLWLQATPLVEGGWGAECRDNSLTVPGWRWPFATAIPNLRSLFGMKYSDEGRGWGKPLEVFQNCFPVPAYPCLEEWSHFADRCRFMQKRWSWKFEIKFQCKWDKATGGKKKGLWFLAKQISLKHVI